MRLMQKTQAIGLIKLLEQAHNQINNALEKEDLQNALGLLEDCQNSGIALGTLIEKAEGEGFVTIPLLEEYSELTYQIHESVAKMRQVNAKWAYKSLRQLLIKISNSVLIDIKVRKEMVFLPYKASMWDSLESIWEAADADPECDAYVIPIPYYEKNPDGTFKKVHYEGDLYPEYVKVIQYDEYDFENRHPDVIFIHNPYDENNIVTSVLPFFYTKNLRQYTDKLVYIPYFVLDEININDTASVESIEHFVTVSAVLYADKVVVQSKNMRQIYIDVLTKFAGEKTRKSWSNKILGIGSPKFDKVMSTKKEGVKVPEEWLKVIQKPDGSWKKVILYNTSVGELASDKICDKIQNVLEVFQKNSNNVALLWRPHPLIEATISSMRPQLLEEYNRVIDDYRGANWGIYDDTAELDRAIRISDAYFGDASSVAHLCRSAGLPVMLKRTESDYRKNNLRLRILDFFDDGKSIWFFALYSNGLFRFDKSSRKTEVVCYLPIKTLSESYRILLLKDDKIYLAPLYADKIVIYDLKKHKLNQLTLQVNSIDCMRMPSDKMANFNGMYAFGKYIFFVPLSFGAIVRLNTETNLIEYFNEFVELLHPIVNNKNAFWFSHSCAVGDKIYMPSSCANALIEFDMNSCTSVLYRIGDEETSYTMICFDDNNFWILNYSGDALIAWNKQNGIVDKMNLNYEGRFNHIFSFGDAIWRIPCNGDLTCDVISKNDRQSDYKIKLQIEKNDQYSVSSLFVTNNAALCVKMEKERLLVYSTQRDSLCVFDKMGKCTDEYIFEVSADDSKSFILSQDTRFDLAVETSSGNKFIIEDFFNTNLSGYIKYILKTDTESNIGNNMTENKGKCIYEYIKKELTNG